MWCVFPDAKRARQGENRKGDVTAANPSRLPQQTGPGPSPAGGPGALHAAPGPRRPGGLPAPHPAAAALRLRPPPPYRRWEKEPRPPALTVLPAPAPRCCRPAVRGWARGAARAQGGPSACRRPAPHRALPPPRAGAGRGTPPRASPSIYWGFFSSESGPTGEAMGHRSPPFQGCEYNPQYYGSPVLFFGGALPPCRQGALKRAAPQQPPPGLLTHTTLCSFRLNPPSNQGKQLWLFLAVPLGCVHSLTLRPSVPSAKLKS